MEIRKAGKGSQRFSHHLLPSPLPPSLTSFSPFSHRSSKEPSPLRHSTFRPLPWPWFPLHAPHSHLTQESVLPPSMSSFNNCAFP